MTTADREIDSEAQADPDASTNALPLLYSDVRPLSADRHGGMSLASGQGYRFAAEAAAVPLNAAELALAGRHYPIVFAPQEPPVPLAVLGLRSGDNLFVDAEGAWRPNCYIPAYVRRYPFILISAPGSERYALGIDEGSGLLVEGGERPLFDNGEPVELTRMALDFCSTYQAQHQATREFCAALDAEGVLVENRADTTLDSGARMSVSGFRVVEQARFDVLSEERILDWRKRGWLPFVYAHLMSAANWAFLADLAAERG